MERSNIGKITNENLDKKMLFEVKFFNIRMTMIINLQI